MKLLGAAHQHRSDDYFDASGIIAGAGAQLVLPAAIARSFLLLQNNSATSMAFAFGGARATCTLAGGAVNAVTVNNGGFGYTYPPKVIFYGGGNGSPPNPTFLSPGQPDYPSPSQPAQATAVLTGNSVSSITIDNPGALYIKPPYVFLRNNDNDPFGVMTPSLAAPSSGGQGSLILATATPPFVVNGTTCPTGAIAVIGTAGASFTCLWMD